MANPRLGRINEEIRRELAQILREVKDPRVGRSFVSITAVDVTPDLKYAKIYYSSLGKKDDPKELQKGLTSATGFIRGQLARRLNLRQTPELSFLRDLSLESGAHISSLLRQVEGELAEADRLEAERAEAERAAGHADSEAGDSPAGEDEA